jgi:hypothetical protein
MSNSNNYKFNGPNSSAQKNGLAPIIRKVSPAAGIGAMDYSSFSDQQRGSNSG